MQCIVLCAGFGTRLYPLTRHHPKQLLTIGSGCVLDQIMDRLLEVAVSRVTLVCNHRFIDAFEHWRSRQPSTIPLRIIDNGVTSEAHRPGAVGDLHLALETLDLRGNFWVLHGDNYFTFSLRPVLRAFQQQGNTLVLYDVRSKARARKAGMVACDAAGRITQFVEKPDQPPSTRVSIGIYVFKKEIRRHIADYMETGLPTDRSGDLMAWLCSRAPLYTYPVSPENGIWVDIGTPQDYHLAKDMAY